MHSDKLARVRPRAAGPEVPMQSTAIQRPAVAAAKRVVIKVGTRVLTRPDGRLALVRLSSIVELLADLRAEGREVILVSSGAIGAGRGALGLAETPADAAVRQACAAVGQGRLMGIYQQGFAPFGLVPAQLLLTEADFFERERYLNLRSALTTLLRLGAVPIINENDVVSIAELAVTQEESRQVFGDNDRLSALVASELEANLLVLLTDVPGLCEQNPQEHAGAGLISTVDDPETLQAEITGAVSGAGRGGMRTKVEAACIAARSGCHAVIASGLDPEAARRVVAGENVGTWFPARSAMSARRRWIAFATRVRAALHIDAGAARALVELGGSLLPAGVTHIEGDFDSGDVVEIRGPEGGLIGRGIIRVGAAAARAWMAGERPEGARTLMRREELVLEGSLR